MFALLGSIQLGLSPFTHPTGAEGNEKSKLARIDVAVGKPALQDMGDDLAGTRLAFFFDESFCDPETEMNRLREARRSRAPLAYVPGEAAFAACASSSRRSATRSRRPRSPAASSGSRRI